MTIAATTRKAGPFIGTGSVYRFEFAFKVFARSEVIVTVSSNDVETVLELDTDYSVSLNEDQDVNPGGTVTLDEALPDGDKLAITSAVPYSQEIALTNKGGFYPTILNEALDKLTAQCQQLQEQNTRTVTVPATSSISPSEYLNEIFDARETAIEKASAAVSSASSASTSATNAQTWAEGNDSAVSALGGTHSAKGWVNLMSPHFVAIEGVYADAENVDKVAASLTKVNTVAGSIAVVTSVANDLTAIDAVNANKTNIDTVAADIANVRAVGADIANVNAVANDLTAIDAVNNNKTNIDTVAADIANVNAVANDLTNVDAVAGNATDINTVAGISANVTTVAGISAAVASVAGIASDISAVEDDLTNIDAVASSIANVNAVAGNATNINAVVANATNINTVASDSSDIALVATNIADVQGVADALTDIGTVATNVSDVSAVANDITSVVAVAGNATNINAVNANKPNINLVAGMRSDIASVASISSDLSTVVGIASDVSAVADIAPDISSVEDISASVKAVASNASNITAVAANRTNVNAVAGNSTNINAVASNATNINTVATNASSISTVSGIASNVTKVATNATAVTTVANDIIDVSAVADDITSVVAVAGDLSNIDAVAGNATNINSVAGNATNINAIASDLTNINAVAADLTNINAASGYAAEAKQWAIGDPSEPSGGSAKYWAQQAASGQVNSDWSETDTTSKAYILNKPTLATVATSGSYTDLSDKPTIPTIPTLAPVATSGLYSDLSGTPTAMVGATASTGGESGFVPAPLAGEEKAYLRGDGTWKDALEGRISNCITYIPQDIKLELSGGTFTLKAGSKVYVPNGVGNFDVVTIESDVSQIITYASLAFLCYDSENNTFKASSDAVSGTTAPSSLGGSVLWYDTANNKIKYYEGGTWSSNALSLPIAKVSSNRSQQSIDKVFIGFGYIGSTIFVLPNVKGLIPDGRNADGTLKNIPFVCTSVLTRELTGTGVKDFAIQEGGSTIRQDSRYVLNEKENLLYTSAGTVEKNCVFASGQTNNGKIISLTPKTTFQAVDINDKKFVRLVETWRSSDGRLWYRKWSDGWIEQGGYHPSTGSWTDCTENLEISFNIPFGNSKNTVQITMAGKGDLANPTKVTTANFTLWIGDRLQATGVSDEFYWYACGY